MENILIEWTEEYNICEIIDEQHKKLVDSINKLYNAFLEAKVKEVVLPIIKDLFEYTVYHFGTEEIMFEQKGYSFTEEHKQEHQNFVDKIGEFAKKYEQGDSLVSYEIMNFLKDWLLNHILISDKKYIEEIC